MIRFTAISMFTFLSATIAAAQTVAVPPVVINQLTHEHLSTSSGSLTITRDYVQFPCTSGNCSGPGFSATITTGTDIVIRFEAPVGQRFAVTRGPGGNQTFSARARWQSGFADTATNFPIASIVFENLVGVAPTLTSDLNQVSNGGLVVLTENNFTVNGDFAFTAMRVEFTVAQSLLGLPHSYGAVNSNSTPSFDSTRMVNGAASDTNLMRIEPFTITTPYCFGDGTGAACPCANNGVTGNGCANSLIAAGANLSSTGIASVANDTCVLIGAGMPNSSALYFQGTLQSFGGGGSIFGDGKRCATGTVIRLGTKLNAAGTSAYPIGADPRISVKGLIPSGGATRDYQVWYRNAAAFCTASTFNLSNGLEIVWTP